jgi:hypothetical protein
VLVLYGLPRDLVSSILAHEAMHVWLKLNQGFPFRMEPRLEEGLCQVVAYLYLQKIAASAEEGMVCMEGAAFQQFAQEQALRYMMPVTVHSNPPMLKSVLKPLYTDMRI